MEAVQHVRAFFTPSEIKTEGLAFRVYYKYFGSFLAILFLALFVGNYFGNPVSCETYDEAKEKIMNEYCKSNIYIITGLIPEEREKPHSYAIITPQQWHEKLYVTRYRYVPLAILFFALVTVCPSLVWRHVENKRVAKKLCLDEKRNGREWPERKLLIVKKIAASHKHLYYYGLWYILCEALCLFEIICSIFCMDLFLGVSNYPLRYFGLMSWGENTMDGSISFPEMAKCTKMSYGIGGNKVYTDGLCHLFFFEIYAHSFIFIWIVFHIFFFIFTTQLIIRIVFLLSPHVRTVYLQSAAPGINGEIINYLISKGSFGSYHLLIMIKSHLDQYEFEEVLKSLKNRITAIEMA